MSMAAGSQPNHGPIVSCSAMPTTCTHDATHFVIVHLLDVRLKLLTHLVQQHLLVALLRKQYIANQAVMAASTQYPALAAAYPLPIEASQHQTVLVQLHNPSTFNYHRHQLRILILALV